MNTEKKKRGRPPKQKVFETTGMTYEGAINYALDQDVKTELDKSLVDKSEDELTYDERKYLKRKKEKKSYTLNVRFTESEMQDILSKCEQYGYKNKTEYIRDCVRARVDLTPDHTEIAETNRLIKDYYIDGKAPKRSELAALSKPLKDKLKAIMPEHKAYLLKHETAMRYTRQVRQYLNEQYMKSEREKSRQRTQAKHRNKNALE